MEEYPKEKVVDVAVNIIKKASKKTPIVGYVADILLTVGDIVSAIEDLLQHDITVNETYDYPQDHAAQLSSLNSLVKGVTIKPRKDIMAFVGYGEDEPGYMSAVSRIYNPNNKEFYVLTGVDFDVYLNSSVQKSKYDHCTIYGSYNVSSKMGNYVAMRSDGEDAFSYNNDNMFFCADGKGHEFFFHAR